MEFYEITPSEKRIIEELRTLKPFEKLEVIADQNGKADSYFVHRSHKVILMGGVVTSVKFKS